MVTTAFVLIILVKVAHFESVVYVDESLLSIYRMHETREITKWIGSSNYFVKK